jgi:CubicO group peptidase (beta-lactamase class C family)
MPAVLDPLRRVSVPRDLAEITTVSEREQDAAAGGMTAEGVERIWASVQRLFRRRMNPAITICVRRRGEVVLDRSLGWARGAGPGEHGERVPVTPDTPFCIFSSSKAITATVVHLLNERGVLRIGDRVVDYVPEFRGDHREDITIEHVLSHRAGIPQIPRDLMDLDRIGDNDFLIAAVQRLKVQTRPGAALAYHAVSGGFVLGEVVRRATGKDIRTVLTEEILRPLGFRWTNYGVAAEDVPRVGLSYATGPRVLPPLSTALTRALGVSVEGVIRIANDPRFLTGIVPAGNVVSTANELSRFMDLLRAGGTLDGVTVLEPRTVRSALRERSYHEIDRTLGFPLRHSSGFMLGAKVLGLYGPDTDEAFGHLGFTNVMTWADPRRELAVGLITSGKPVLGPHLGSVYRFTREVARAAGKVDRPVLYSS